MGSTLFSERARWKPISSLRAIGSAAIIGGTLASTVALTSPAIAQTGTSPAAYVPSTALAYAQFELDQDSDQVVKAHDLYERTNLDALMTSEQQEQTDFAVQTFGEFADGDVAVFLNELPADVIETFMGAGTSVASDPEAAINGDVPQGWAAVLQPADAQAAYDKYVQMIFGEETPESEEYEGYTIQYIAATEDAPGVAIALVDDVIVAATIPDDIKPVIDTATGTSAPLSEDEEFGQVTGALNAEFLASGYIDGPAIMDAIEADENASAVLSQIPSQYLDSFNAYQGYAFWADDPGFRLDSVAFPGEGVELPAASEFGGEFASNVPDSSLVYAGGTDLGQNPGLNALALAMATELTGAANPMEAATPVADPEAYAEQVFADAEATLGFNIKTEVLDQLVGEWGAAFSINDIDVSTMQPDMTAVFVTEVDDAETVGNVTSQITNMIESQAGNDVDLSSRQVNGADVTVLDFSESSGMPTVLEFGVVDGKLIIGLNGAIDSFLGEQDAPLADSALYQDTMSALPENPTSVLFVNLEQALPLAQEMIEASGGTSSTEDADPSCGEYDSQEDAQAAYDEDTFENYLLDLDFDGEACEDFFAESSPEASPVSVEELGLRSIGSVTTTTDESTTSNTLILIAD